MLRSDIGYTGEGMPPFCQMTFKAVSGQTTPPNLQFTVILGVFYAPNNTFQLTWKAEIVTDIVLEGNW